MKYIPPIGGAANDSYVDGNPAGGVEGSPVPAAAIEHPQREIEAVIAAAGLVPAVGDLTQLRQAISKMINSPGKIVYFPGNTAPIGYIKANGALLSRAAYADLYAYALASGNIVADGVWQAGMFSTGNLTTTFRIPDLRAEFPRGWDDGRGVDSGRVLGSAQADEMKSHAHTLNMFQASQSFTAGASSGVLYSTGGMAVPSSSIGGVETRSRNVALLACIKY